MKGKEEQCKSTKLGNIQMALPDLSKSREISDYGLWWFGHYILCVIFKIYNKSKLNYSVSTPSVCKSNKRAVI